MTLNRLLIKLGFHGTRHLLRDKQTIKNMDQIMGI